MGRIPPASSDDALRRMKLQQRRDTKPEMALRRELHRRGFRYRVDVSPVAGLRRRADIIFTSARVAVFVHGCFWHGCPDHGTKPKANAEWWAEKLERNISRDVDTRQQVEAAGWAVVEMWEHEDPIDVADKLALLIRSRLPT
jgi:DNA mismatch endonuclease (patch repair protein)